MGEPLTVIILIGLGLLIALAAYFSQTPCPGCKKRGTMKWDKERKDGGPDRRFKENEKRCTACGYVVS